MWEHDVTGKLKKVLQKAWPPRRMHRDALLQSAVLLQGKQEYTYLGSCPTPRQGASTPRRSIALRDVGCAPPLLLTTQLPFSSTCTRHDAAKRNKPNSICSEHLGEWKMQKQTEKENFKKGSVQVPLQLLSDGPGMPKVTVSGSCLQ